MSDSFDWLTLEEDAEVLWSGRAHPATLYMAYALGIVLIPVLVGIPYLLWARMRYRTTEYVLTDQHLYTRRGVVSRSVEHVDLERVQDTSYNQSVIGARFGYGTVSVETEDHVAVAPRLKSVQDPAEVYGLVDRQVSRVREDIDDRAEDLYEEAISELRVEVRSIRSLLERAVDEDDDPEQSGAARYQPQVPGRPRARHPDYIARLKEQQPSSDA